MQRVERMWCVCKRMRENYNEFYRLIHIIFHVDSLSRDERDVP